MSGGSGIDRCSSGGARDIYIDAADSTATNAWLDPVKAQGWVLMQLKAQDRDEGGMRRPSLPLTRFQPSLVVQLLEQRGNAITLRVRNPGRRTKIAKPF